MLSDSTIRLLITIIVCAPGRVEEYQNIIVQTIAVHRYIYDSIINMPTYWIRLLGTQLTILIHCIGYYIYRCSNTAEYVIFLQKFPPHVCRR